MYQHVASELNLRHLAAWELPDIWGTNVSMFVSSGHRETVTYLELRLGREASDSRIRVPDLSVVTLRARRFTMHKQVEEPDLKRMIRFS